MKVWAVREDGAFRLTRGLHIPKLFARKQDAKGVITYSAEERRINELYRCQHIDNNTKEKCERIVPSAEEWKKAFEIVEFDLVEVCVE